MELSSFDLKNYMTNTAVKIMYERNFINMHLEQMDILLNKTSSNDEILAINEVVLANYQEFVLE